MTQQLIQYHKQREIPVVQRQRFVTINSYMVLDSGLLSAIIRLGKSHVVTCTQEIDRRLLIDYLTCPRIGYLTCTKGSECAAPIALQN